MRMMLRMGKGGLLHTVPATYPVTHHTRNKNNPKKPKAKFFIRRFWNQYQHLSGYDKRIELLKKYAEIVVFKRNRWELKQKREEFLRIRAFNEFFKKACSACGNEKVIRHHVIQLQNGGTNSFENIIPVCERCHSDIHPHLPREM